jgi:hypothetical protein
VGKADGVVAGDINKRRIFLAYPHPTVKQQTRDVPFNDDLTH